MTGTAIVRLVMAVAWVVWAALAWWSAPRMAGSEQLHSDLAQGRIRSYSMADTWQEPRFWAAPPTPIRRQHNSMLVWTTGNGQTYYLTSVPGQSFARELDRANVAPIGVSPLAPITSLMGVVLALAALGILLGAGDPVRGTRWFWFWVGQLPLGLGYLAWLAWERPWADPDAEKISKRHNGFLGLGVLLAGGLVITVLVLLARKLFGPWAVPGE